MGTVAGIGESKALAGIANMNCTQCQVEYLRRVRRVQGMAAVWEHLAFLGERYDMTAARAAIESARKK